VNQNESTEARSIFEEGVAILREIGDKNLLAYAVRRLGLLAWREKDFARATVLCQESLSLNREIGDPRGVLASLAGFADIAVGQWKYARAAQLMAAVETQLAALGMRLLPVDKMEYDRNLALLCTQLGEKVFNKTQGKGREMSLDEAIAFALEE
jgi:hypothetical protein